jgi:hypothetical protein
MKDVNLMAFCSNLLPFRIVYGHLVYFVVILVYFFGMLHQENLATLQI